LAEVIKFTARCQQLTDREKGKQFWDGAGISRQSVSWNRAVFTTGTCHATTALFMQKPNCWQCIPDLSGGVGNWI